MNIPSDLGRRYTFPATWHLLLAFVMLLTLGDRVNAQVTTNTTTEDQITAANTATELAKAKQAQAEAEKAQYEAALAAAKAKIGDIQASGYTGSTEIGDKAGNAEALLLGTVAVNEIASKFTTSIINKAKPSGITKLLLFTSQTTPDFQALLAFNAQFSALEYAKKNAELSTEGVKYGLQVEPSSLATVGLGLDAINKLLSFFKTDYSFKGIEIESTDSMLLSALAGDLQLRGIDVEIPSLYHPAALGKVDIVLDQINKLYGWGLQAKQRVNAYEIEQGKIEKQLALNPKDDVAKEQLTKVKEALDIWKVLAERIDSWAKQIAGADDKGSIPLASIISQAAIKTELNSGAGFVVVQLKKVAGTSYTKKNLWSSLGANPFYVMGGAVASMTAFKGKEGTVFASALVPWHGGYHSVSDIQSVVNKSEDIGSTSSNMPQ